MTGIITPQITTSGTTIVKGIGLISKVANGSVVFPDVLEIPDTKIANPMTTPSPVQAIIMFRFNFSRRVTFSPLRFIWRNNLQMMKASTKVKLISAGKIA